LGVVATPAIAHWTDRGHPEKRSRSSHEPYAVDRDRIIHSVSFRELQYKTQVQGLLGARQGGARTRLNHVLEVAQLARSIARAVDATESLVEAIALAHDLGHPPFGHAGERALQDALAAAGLPGWNANVHSLDVVDAVERSFIGFRGLNLTWATREGIARHATPFDVPVSIGEFASTKWGGLECQIVDAADVLAYLTHDLDDALADGYLQLSDLSDTAPVIAELIELAERDWTQSGAWPQTLRSELIRHAVVARLISRSLADLAATTIAAVAHLSNHSPEAVRDADSRTVKQSAEFARVTLDLLELLTARYYRSDSVRESDSAAAALLQATFAALTAKSEEIPPQFARENTAIAAATYLASLNDYSVVVVARRLGVA
jgi:dGTPase